VKSFIAEHSRSAGRERRPSGYTTSSPFCVPADDMPALRPGVLRLTEDLTIVYLLRGAALLRLRWPPRARHTVQTVNPMPVDPGRASVSGGRKGGTVTASPDAGHIAEPHAWAEGGTLMSHRARTRRLDDCCGGRVGAVRE
jgi:hypothetical protein